MKQYVSMPVLADKLTAKLLNRPSIFDSHDAIENYLKDYLKDSGINVKKYGDFIIKNNELDFNKTAIMEIYV